MVFLVLLSFAFVFPSFLPKAWGVQTVEKKIGGIQGNPATKRGMDIGFDRGVTAAKQDRDAGLEPDLNRHDDFENAKKFYRYEFGSRITFLRAFRRGFIGGYKRVFGEDTKLKISSSKESLSITGATMESSIPSPSSLPPPVRVRKVKKSSPPSLPVDTASDAL